ncbi:hypothetical protein C7974DRAFT_456725, partial [Boeremia exigua]|uniref:uncharacterized protein n=1 Tax=Boeremia exigua TaxID=749465 RepID=UPI001E8CCE4A
SLSATVTALALLATTINGLPTKQKPTYTPATNLDNLAKLMPKSALPAPDGLTLKYVVLGIGTQNYTCGDDESAAPGTTGATAALYDIGTPLSTSPFARWTLPSISPLALSLSSRPSAFTQNLQSLGYSHLIGHHFFAGASPVFALDQLASPYPFTALGKVAETDAPAASCPGTKGEGAIKWLLLKDAKGLSRGGIDTVYRIETAGGNKPATCTGKGGKAFEVAYSAQCKWCPPPGLAIGVLT